MGQKLVGGLGLGLLSEDKFSTRMSYKIARVHVHVIYPQYIQAYPTPTQCYVNLCSKSLRSKRAYISVEVINSIC